MVGQTFCPLRSRGPIKKTPSVLFLCYLFNVKIPTSSDKTATMAAPASVSSATAIGYNFSLEELLLVPPTSLPVTEDE